MTNIATAPSRLEPKYGEIEKVNSFIYLGKIVRMEISEKETNNSSRENMLFLYFNYSVYERGNLEVI